jgi:hypothetical protein
VIALGVIAVLAPTAAAGGVTLGIAVLFHEGSTVLVVLNALRLLTHGGRATPIGPDPFRRREPRQRAESSCCGRCNEPRPGGIGRRHTLTVAAR